jgi:hypothetical protein
MGPVVLRSRVGTELVVLEGSDAPLLGQLSDAEVQVCGELMEGRRRMTVEAFELRTVDGLPALLGTLGEGGSMLWLRGFRGGDSVGLVGAPAALRGRNDQLIWVAGDWEEERFLIQAFGFLKGG